MLDGTILKALSEPFGEEELKFRDGGGGKKLAYIDARSVVARLNAVVGPQNWSDSYTPFPVTVTDKNNNTVHHAGMLCSLTVFGITKQGISDPDNTEVVKSLESGSLKRAGAKFGIGAYLYGLKDIRPKDFDDLPDWAQPSETKSPDELILALFKEKMGNADVLDLFQGYSLNLSLAEKRDLYGKLKNVPA